MIKKVKKILNESEKAYLDNQKRNLLLKQKNEANIIRINSEIENKKTTFDENLELKRNKFNSFRNK